VTTTASLFPVRYQIKQFHILSSCCCKDHFSAILSSTPDSSKCCLISVILDQRCVRFYLLYACYLALTSYIAEFDNLNNIWWRIRGINVQSFFTSSFLYTNILLSTDLRHPSSMFFSVWDTKLNTHEGKLSYLWGETIYRLNWF
jgi:REP element-mobilizing transposase RayT